MAYRDGITAEMARELLNYDPDTGEFRWKPRTAALFAKSYHTAEHNCAVWNKLYSGGVVGYVSKRDGYRRVSIFDTRYLLHRLAWLISLGTWPSSEIDHINGKRDDNRLENLREATPAENSQNRSHKSVRGLLGASWFKRDNNWRATIKINKKWTYLGYFDTEQEAHEAYLAAKRFGHPFNPVPRKG